MKNFTKRACAIGLSAVICLSAVPMSKIAPCIADAAEGLTYGGFAFYNCTSLKEFVADENIIDISINAFEGCENLASLTIKNPECNIYDSEKAIPATTVIYGHSGSTAETYAATYGREFVILGNTPAQTSTTGDVDGDGNIAISDASAILTYYAQNAAGLDPTWNEILGK